MLRKERRHQQQQHLAPLVRLVLLQDAELVERSLEEGSGPLAESRLLLLMRQRLQQRTVEAL